MLNIGMSEILLFAAIALIVLGPDKLPEAARFAGRWYGKLKRMVSNVQNDIDRELRLGELREQMQQELERIKQLEEKMQAQISQIEQHNLVDHQPFKAQKVHQLDPIHPKSFTLCQQPQFKTPFLVQPPLSPTLINLKKAV